MGNKPKLCLCGCGNPTNMARKNSKQYGWIKGEPLRYLPSHGQPKTQKRGKDSPSWKEIKKKTVSPEGYVFVNKPEHPRSGQNGYVAEHVLIAEKALGHFLTLPNQVHHVDEDKAKNTNDNLVVCQDELYHRLLHARTKAYHACGNPEWRRCQKCKEYDSLDNMKSDGRANSPRYSHKHCKKSVMSFPVSRDS